MTPVTQTLFGGGENGIPGNCYQAAIASILNLSLDAVPHFVLFEARSLYIFKMWLKDRGLDVSVYGMKWFYDEEDPLDINLIPEGEYVLASGMASRGFSHSCVYQLELWLVSTSLVSLSTLSAPSLLSSNTWYKGSISFSDQTPPLLSNED